MTHFVHPLVQLWPGLDRVRHHIWRAFWTLEAAWRVRRERRALQGLDERALKDVGLTQSAVWAEAQRPFWDVPGDRLPR
jgi:uncharacterized protein YjiS (DUF1127 family)